MHTQPMPEPEREILVESFIETCVGQAVTFQGNAADTESVVAGLAAHLFKSVCLLTGSIERAQEAEDQFLARMMARVRKMDAANANASTTLM
jgi:hypothetical protein